MRKVIVLLVVIGAIGAVSVIFNEYMKRIGVNVRLEVIQKTALLGKARTLKQILFLKVFSLLFWVSEAAFLCFILLLLVFKPIFKGALTCF